MSGDKPASEPHYAGHRDRLRDRFRKIGGESFEDYELLEKSVVMYGETTEVLLVVGHGGLHQNLWGQVALHTCEVRFGCCG